ncbi:MAG: DM13 domain-containing protein [Chloroflexi bacterium]|nr:DM13 domain-containing protein [Chloroflexota bacterium]
MSRPSLLAAAALLILSAACSPSSTPAVVLPPPAVSTKDNAVIQPATASATAPAVGVAQAAPSSGQPSAGAALQGAFVKEEVNVTGSFTLNPATGRLVLSDDFGVVPGPDLYVVLSGAGDLTADYHAFSRMVTSSAKLNLGLLARTTGAQTYIVPEATDLTQFKTVVIWCESFSVAFAAAPLSGP